MARLFNIDGSVKTVYPADKKKGFSLKECYDLIGCKLVEMVSMNGYDYIVDEEGLLNAEPVINLKATIECGVPLVGNVLRCDPGEFQ